MIKIYLRSIFTIEVPAEPVSKSNYDFVATIDTNDLNTAWRLSQNVDALWVTAEFVQPAFPYTEGCRSSSVGDVFVTDDGKAWLIENIGFRQVEFIEGESNA